MVELKVKAISGGDVRWAGYYDHARRKPGDIFILKNEEHFSHLWMQAIGWKPKEKSVADKKVAKEIIRTAGGAMGSRQSAMDKAKGGKVVSLSQMAGVSAAEPVPATVVDVNVNDTSHNPAEEAI